MRCEDDRSRLLMSVQSEVFLRTGVTSEHATQHGQTLNVTHLTIVLEPVENHVKGYARSLLSVLCLYAQTTIYNVSNRCRPKGCLAQGVPASGSGSGLRSRFVAAEARAHTLHNTFDKISLIIIASF